MVFILVQFLLSLIERGANLVVMESVLHASVQWLLPYPEVRIVFLHSIRDIVQASDHCKVCQRWSSRRQNTLEHRSWRKSEPS